jgi:hypothetical protein
MKRWGERKTRPFKDWGRYVGDTVKDKEMTKRKARRNGDER